MALVRIIAMALLLVSVIFYFTAKEYAIYPAALGFIMIALINLPVNIWINIQLRKAKKEKPEQSDPGQIDNK